MTIGHIFFVPWFGSADFGLSFVADVNVLLVSLLMYTERRPT